MLQRFRAAGGSLLLTTHYMDEAQVLCDRVAIVDGGRIIAEGTPHELIASLGAAHVIEFGLARRASPTAPLAAQPTLLGVRAVPRRRLLASARDAGPDAPALTAQLEALPGVRSVGRDGDRWQLGASDLQETLPALMRFAEDGGIALDAVTTHAATLEDVFVSLTGRHLRDG